MKDWSDQFVIVLNREHAFFETISVSKRNSIERFLHDNPRFLDSGWNYAQQMGYECVPVKVTVEFET